MPSVAESPLDPTETVTVRAEATAASAVAVTVTCVAPASSLTVDGDVVSVTTGWRSSSASVSVVPVTVECALVPATSIVSLPSTVESSVGVSVNVPVPPILLAGMVIVKSVTAA